MPYKLLASLRASASYRQKAILLGLKVEKETCKWRFALGIPLTEHCFFVGDFSTTNYFVRGYERPGAGNSETTGVSRTRVRRHVVDTGAGNSETTGVSRIHGGMNDA